jgi:hypothetical protein
VVDCYEPSGNHVSNFRNGENQSFSYSFFFSKRDILLMCHFSMICRLAKQVGTVGRRVAYCTRI